MEIQLTHDGRRFRADLSRPIDISIPLRHGMENPNCFYATPPEFNPLREGDFTGSVAAGAPVNFFNVRINPHGNGTHTECVGHISPEGVTINQQLKKFHFIAKLISLFPVKTPDGDRIITRDQVEGGCRPGEAEALILRTLPNDRLKLRTHYSGANPPYLQREAVLHLVECGIRHLLVDLPSVDREEDGGALAAHRAFWDYPGASRKDCTISELIFVDNSVKDGLYLLNLQIASFELDVSPGKPVLYSLDLI